ncbi:unnamed protein product [Gongylonema pulchrum]|uniref:Uncharacterized protein n=1 Tax=Gongylonema pulchrum TaxID=637853 RepID=A0A183EJH9_9BILA|nr:unnamed protein product [Gongylonema pulchrum]
MQRDGSARLSQRRTLPSKSSSSSTASRLDPLSLGVVASDNRQAVVIEIGNALTKFVHALLYFRRVFSYH